ncbi:MAG: peptidase [Cyclobacteriaceae bacterium]
MDKSFLYNRNTFGIRLFSCLVLLVPSVKDMETGREGENIRDRDAACHRDHLGEKLWDDDFRIVEIKSGIDGHIQRAYFYRAKAEGPRPLVVSLHTWSGSYSQADEIAELSRERGVHYIHPDFRGPNTTVDACCSALALNDIDEAISWAMLHASVDTSKIYMIGVSGGGYATLSAFMKSKHPVKRFSAWASITDLAAWYDECRIRQYKYADDILRCTGSDTLALNIPAAKGRSPLYWPTPVPKLDDAVVFIYAGIHDGVTGSVPITHSINFYNKLLADLGVTDSMSYVSGFETKNLLLTRQPLGDFGHIGSRRICLRKDHGNIRLVIFDGGHEMLADFAFAELMQ